MTKESEKERLKKEILKSGLPLELEVTRIFENAGWEVQNQFPYEDPNEQKVRLIDVIAKRQIPPHYIMASVECKKSDKSWVFFTRPKRSLKSIFSRFEEFEKLQTGYLAMTTSLAITYYVGFSGRSRGKSNRDIIFAAINQVAKANTYIRNQALMALKLQPRDLEDMFLIPYIKHQKKKETTIPPQLVFPAIIVLEGKIWEAKLEKSKLILNRSPYVQYMMLHPGEIGVQMSVIEIMDKRFLLEYLKNIDNVFLYDEFPR